MRAQVLFAWGQMHRAFAVRRKAQVSLEAMITFACALALLSLLAPAAASYSSSVQEQSEEVSARSLSASNAFLLNSLYNNAPFSSFSAGVSSSCFINSSEVVCKFGSVSSACPLLHAGAVSKYEKSVFLPV